MIKLDDNIKNKLLHEHITFYIVKNFMKIVNHLLHICYYNLYDRCFNYR